MNVNPSIPNVITIDGVIDLDEVEVEGHLILSYSNETMVVNADLTVTDKS